MLMLHSGLDRDPRHRPSRTSGYRSARRRRSSSAPPPVCRTASAPGLRDGGFPGPAPALRVAEVADLLLGCRLTVTIGAVAVGAMRAVAVPWRVEGRCKLTGHTGIGLGTRAVGCRHRLLLPGQLRHDGLSAGGIGIADVPLKAFRVASVAARRRSQTRRRSLCKGCRSWASRFSG